MRNRILFAMAGALFLLASAVLGGGVARAEQIELPEHVFAPVGFDDNDSSQVVLFGHFPDSCYQAGPVRVTIQGERIMLRNVSYHQSTGPCLMVVVPWTTPVNLGILPAGHYTLSVESPDGSMRSFGGLEVFTASTHQRDDFTYAYVNGAIVSRDQPLPVLTISGAYSLTCMELAEVRVGEKNGVIVVMPIVRLREGEPCGYPFAPIPFTTRITLDPKTPDHTLVHIRSMNGQALNLVIDH